MSMLSENPLFKITPDMLEKTGLNMKQAMSLGARYKDEFFMLAAHHFPRSHDLMSHKNKEELLKAHEERKKKAEKDSKEGNPRFIHCPACKHVKTCYTKQSKCKDCIDKEEEENKERMRRKWVQERKVYTSSPHYDRVHAHPFL